MNDDPRDSHRVEASKKKLDEYIAAIGDEQIQNEKHNEVMNDDTRGDPIAVDEPDAPEPETLVCAPGSSSDIRIPKPTRPEIPIEPLVDNGTQKSEIRVQSPVRQKASKRRTEVPHPDEPGHKFVATADSPTQEATHFDISTPVGGSNHHGMAIPEVADDEMLSIEQRQLSSTDCLFLSSALIGKDMNEVVGPVSVSWIEKAVGEVLGVDIMEMYSPERVATLCKQFGLSPGCSLDLTNGFDFDTAADRKRAWDIVHCDEPLLLIGSPPCTYFSVLNQSNKHLNRNNPVWIRRFDRSR